MNTATAAVPELCVPPDLSDYDQWVLWRYEVRSGKRTKVPYTVQGRRASTTSPGDWASFEAALDVWRRFPKGYSGLGFVFSKADPFTGIDLDDCLDSVGQVKEWASGTVERFSETYMEISPSGLGIKIWARGTIPENLPGVPVGDGSIELYDHARYFTVTGHPFRGAPRQVEEYKKDLLLLYERLRAIPRKGWPRQPQSNGRIPAGVQHLTLISILGTLRARHICDEAIEACLQIVNKRQCENPGPRENIARMVRSTRRWGNRNR